MFATYAGATGLTITAGPDGAMWFAVFGNNELGRVTIATPSPTISQITPNTIAVNSPATPLRILGSALAGTSSSPCSGSPESATWNGTSLTITNATAGEIDVTVPANLLTTVGSFTIAVSVQQINGTACQNLMTTGTVQVTASTKTATATLLTASPNPALVDQMVTLTATVTPTTTGSVVFYDGATSIGTVNLSAGVATLAMEFTAGSHSLTATFSGNSTYASSATTPFSLQINPLPPAPATYLTAAPSSQSLGNRVTLTATVCWCVYSGPALPPVPTGAVTFLDGTTQIGSSQLMVGAGSSVATISISTLAVGTHNLTASYSGDVNNGPSKSSTVFLTITGANTPSILAGGVVNAASYAQANGVGSPIAPGSLVAIFTSTLSAQPGGFTTATLPSQINGVSVTFNNVTAPMVNVSPTGPYPFVSVQVPFEVLAEGQTSTTASVVITVNTVPSAPVQAQIVASQPGIFTLNSEGTGQAVLVNLADYTIAAPSGSTPGGHPIPRGQSAYFYLTGLGAMTPSVPDGSGTCPASNGICNANAMPTVFVGGVQAQVLFAGQAAPYPGVQQINLTIPSNAPTGDAVSLVVISADGTVTSNTATIAVQ
jgi:uncharacterized protein (TIGR03437 family)